MPDTHDYPLAEVLGTGDTIHHAWRVGLLGSRVETRCGLRGYRSGRDGGVMCAECVARERAEADTYDESGGDETPVCSTPCDPDCDAVCHEDHIAGHKKQHWPYDCLAAERYSWGGLDFIAAAVKRLRGERDEARARLAAATARAEKAEAEVERLLRRDAVQTEAIRAAKGLANCWRQLAEAADAAQDGLDATETGGEGNCPWCGTRQRLDADGMVSSHEHPTYCNECPGTTRRPSDDATEGER
jgi:hypothetical protein